MFVAFALGFVCSSIALAADPPPPPIVGGEPTSDYQAVGAIATDIPESWGPNFFFCSGTLISPEWVLTAGHCIAGLQGYSDHGVPGFKFFMGTNFNTGAGQIDEVDVDAWYQHPDYNPETLAHDLGLLHLSDAVTSVDPMAVNTDTVTNSWQGRDIVYVGFGATSDSQGGSGIKRWVSVPIEWVDEKDIITYQPGSNVCQGDSGGAMFYELEQGGYELLGVNSFVFSKGGSSYCEEGGGAAARVDNDLDWIESYTPINAEPESDADTDADADTDTDSDADADTDSDADLDDTGDEPGGGLADAGGGETPGTCASTGLGTGGAWAALMALGALLVRRRR